MGWNNNQDLDLDLENESKIKLWKPLLFVFLAILLLLIPIGFKMYGYSEQAREASLHQSNQEELKEIEAEKADLSRPFRKAIERLNKENEKEYGIGFFVKEGSSNTVSGYNLWKASSESLPLLLYEKDDDIIFIFDNSIVGVEDVSFLAEYIAETYYPNQNVNGQKEKGFEKIFSGLSPWDVDNGRIKNADYGDLILEVLALNNNQQLSSEMEIPTSISFIRIRKPSKQNDDFPPSLETFALFLVRTSIEKEKLIGNLPLVDAKDETIEKFKAQSNVMYSMGENPIETVKAIDVVEAVDAIQIIRNAPEPTAEEEVSPKQ